MSFEQISISRNFVLENQLTGNVDYLTIKLLYIPNTEEVNLFQALAHAYSQGVPIKDSLIFFVDFNKRMDVYIGNFPQEQICLRKENILCDIIRLKYKPIQRNQDIIMNVQPIRKKIKQRTIRQAILGVQQWINLYNLIDQKGNKIHTLESASQIVGISKKTLDDYYKHIKLGDKYLFDFDNHQDSRVGILRKFIRNKHNLKRQQKQIDPQQFWDLSMHQQKFHER